jgi:hypothetical protein
MTVLVGELGFNAADRHPGSFSWPRLRHGLRRQPQSANNMFCGDDIALSRWTTSYMPFLKC